MGSIYSNLFVFIWFKKTQDLRTFENISMSWMNQKLLQPSWGHLDKVWGVFQNSWPPQDAAWKWSRWFQFVTPFRPKEWVLWKVTLNRFKSVRKSPSQKGHVWELPRHVGFLGYIHICCITWTEILTIVVQDWSLGFLTTWHLKWHPSSLWFFFYCGNLLMKVVLFLHVLNVCVCDSRCLLCFCFWLFARV